MSMKLKLGIAAFALIALVAGIAYWRLGENSQLGAPSGSAGAPPVVPQATPPLAPPASQSASTEPKTQPAAPPSPTPAPSSPAVIAQSNQPVSSPPLAPPPSSNTESSVPSPLPATPPAPTTTLPAEDQMSEADRRQVQQMLQGMKFYHGPIDGKFGPLTRTAIRRYQDSIGAKSTGYLTAEEATKLASTR
jgi:hypothetical protein